LDPSVTDLQAQIDRLSLAMHRGREAQAHVEPLARRLAHLTERCGDILDAWTETDQRHAQAVTEVEARLNAWGAIEGRLERDAVDRLRDLQRAIEQEWQALRQMQEEPIRQLREHATALGELCVTATNTAAQSFERAEARLAALEAGIQEQFGQMSRDLRLALETGHQNGSQGPAAAASVEPFPLESVLRIHDEHRESARTGALARPEPAAAATRTGPVDVPTLHQLPEAAASLVERMESLERGIAQDKQEVHDAVERAAGRQRREWRLSMGLFGAAVVVLGLLGYNLQRQLTARLDDAATRVAAAERQAATATDLASRQLENTRAEAEQQMAEARDTARRASIVSTILAAPDLVRFSLVPTEPDGRGSAQVLFSRTRGLVLSGSRLPPLPAGSTYQLWLLTNAEPVSGGLFAPDGSGGAMIATDQPISIPRAVNGATVTIETGTGAEAPVGPAVLAQARRATG
jgi:hypothetical protein